jgi:hypothetical protein
MPGARASPVASHADHKRLLQASIVLKLSRERAAQPFGLIRPATKSPNINRLSQAFSPN